MAAETNQAIVCRYCGRSISHVRQLSLHGEGRCDQAVTEVLSAKTKHGATLGEHYTEQREQKHQEALRTLDELPNWRNDVQQFGRGVKESIDRHYHEIMLAEMTLELVLILVLVILAWKQS